MGQITLVRGARQLLTLRGPSGPRRGTDLRNLAIIQDGAILIHNGRIADVGPSRRVENLALAKNADVIDAHGRVVMPGFIDSHAHVIGAPALSKGQEPRAIAHAIQELSPRTLQAHALHAVAEAVRHGTTTIEAKSGLGLNDSNELKILRVHAALEKQSVPLISTFMRTEPSPDPASLLPLIKRRKLAEFAGISCVDGAFSLDQARDFLTAARDLGFQLKLETGPRPPLTTIALATEFGATSVDHIVGIDPAGAALLAQSPIIARLAPGPHFYTGTRDWPPARNLIDSGVALALATNYNPVTCPSQNMQMTIALACGHMHLTPAEAVSACTINAAHALRRAGFLGSLERGKLADLIILSVPDYREIPYHFGVNLVELVMKAGTVLVERSEVKWPAP